MTTRWRIMAALAAAVLGAAASNARAGAIAVGDPYVSGSWSQAWTDPEGFTYDTIAMQIVSANSFETPAFSGGGVLTNSNNSTFAVATFSPTTNASWINNFLGLAGTPPVAYNWYVYEPGHNVASAAYEVFYGSGGAADAGSG